MQLLYGKEIEEWQRKIGGTENRQGQKTDMQEELDWGFKRGGEVKEPLISSERWNKVTSVPLTPCCCVSESRNAVCVSPWGFVFNLLHSSKVSDLTEQHAYRPIFIIFLTSSALCCLSFLSSLRVRQSFYVQTLKLSAADKRCCICFWHIVWTAAM